MTTSIEGLLRPLIRATTFMKVKRSRRAIPVTSSKFGGTPYLETGEEWPTCSFCKKPLTFVCQVDLRKTKFKCPRGVAFFTFFYCWECGGGADETPGLWHVNMYKAP